MKKPFRKIVSCMILFAATCFATVTLCTSAALCETRYVSIKEIRETLPERWTGDYVITKGDGINIQTGDTVSVDVPIVVPEVDAVPVVRITWEPPIDVTELDESLEVKDNSWSIKMIARNFPEAESPAPLQENLVTFDPALPCEEAPTIAIEEIKKWLPFMKDTEFTYSYQDSRGVPGDDGYQFIHYYKTYHGIPQLVGGDPFQYQVESELGPASKERSVPASPLSKVCICIRRPGEFWVNILSSKEVGVDIEDIPLLPFEEILKVLGVIDGYAYSLNEVHFGYMAFIDPEKKGEEFILMPIWAAKGRTRDTVTIPFDLKTSQAVVDQGGYESNAIFIVNAQTGQTYDLYNDVRPDRHYVPHIITWDDVK